MQNSFLPEEYKAPDNSSYMKLQEGLNTFRVLSSAVIGFVYWNNDSKPVRSPEAPEGTPEDIRTGKDGNPEKIKHFWAFVVWNYEASKIQILEVTQKTIQDQLLAYVKNQRWGDPKKYDITIQKSGQGLDTAYIVQANPPLDIPSKEILVALKSKLIDLTALYRGEDPFGNNIGVVTVGPTTKTYSKNAVKRPSGPAEVVEQAFAARTDIEEGEEGQAYPEQVFASKPVEGNTHPEPQGLKASREGMTDEQSKLAEELGF